MDVKIKEKLPYYVPKELIVASITELHKVKNACGPDHWRKMTHKQQHDLSLKYSGHIKCYGDLERK